ncbi:MAG: acetate/propionate family kinase [Burkholderiaceae bacterium]|nr:acetate/propionate family kinase [Burkholderiaceae bacterium]
MTTVLAVNAGSSSLKLAWFEVGDGTLVERRRMQVAADAAAAALDAHADDTLLAAGHRVVFGGLEHSAPARVTPERLAQWQALVPFAPLHQPGCLAPIEQLRRARPALPQVACFDTAFHRTMPAVAQRYGVPRALHDAGARRWGFHGLSYEHVAARLAALEPRASRAVIAHLGSGASLCALRDGRSMATSMGFSALGGVMMATRPGELDPGLVLWLQRERGLRLDELETLLYRECGLKGVSGESADLRALLASHHAAAREAVELYVYRIAREIGSLAAALDGIDALVFTGGVGEHAAPIRAAVAERCRWLGLMIDAAANARAHGETAIADAASAVRVWVIPTDEERVIAQHTLALMGSMPRAT